MIQRISLQLLQTTTVEVLLDVLGIKLHVVSEFCVYTFVHNIHITV